MRNAFTFDAKRLTLFAYAHICWYWRAEIMKCIEFVNRGYHMELFFWLTGHQYSPVPYGNWLCHIVAKTKLRMPFPSNMLAGLARTKSKQTITPKVTLKSVVNVIASGSLVTCISSLYGLYFRYLKNWWRREIINWILNACCQIKTYLAMFTPLRSKINIILYTFVPSIISPQNIWSSSEQGTLVYMFIATYFLALRAAHEIFRNV